MELFRLTGANIGYSGAPVLHDISLSIRAGERVALIGRSGSGKSTLLSTLYDQQRQRAALVPQEFALVRTLSVFHNVYMGRLHAHSSLYNLLNLAWPLKREQAAVSGVLERVGLEDKLGERVGALSGGQQQRTAMARALFQGGEVLLGDEPVSSVDQRQGRLLLEAVNAAFATVVVAMHDVQLALDHTDRVIGLKHGRVVLDAPSANVSADALDELYAVS